MSPIPDVADTFCCRYLMLPIPFVADTFCDDTFCYDTFCADTFCDDTFSTRINLCHLILCVIPNYAVTYIEKGQICYQFNLVMRRHPAQRLIQRISEGQNILKAPIVE